MAADRGATGPVRSMSEARRSGTIALIGRPNAGKSTLLNQLVGADISIVSDKPQTTRHRIRGILTEPRGQAVFVDTPGVHRPQSRMNRRMMEMTRRALGEVDLVAVLIDATESRGGGHDYLLSLLKDSKAPVLLLNKVDRLPKPKLLPMIEWYARRELFADIIPLSALTGDNCRAFLDVVFSRLPAGPPLFPEDDLTDRSVRFMVAEMVREQLLQRTRDELPYTTAVTIEHWDEQEGSATRIGATIYVDRPGHKPIVIGKGGQMLRSVGTAARKRAEKLLGCRVMLELWVKVKPDWREQARLLDELEITS